MTPRELPSSSFEAGEFSVAIHGAPWGVENPSTKQVDDVEWLAKRIERSPGYSSNLIVRMLSCNTGRDPTAQYPISFAQKLADRLGVIVLAPTSFWFAGGDNDGIVSDFNNPSINAGNYSPTGRMNYDLSLPVLPTRKPGDGYPGQGFEFSKFIPAAGVLDFEPWKTALGLR